MSRETVLILLGLLVLVSPFVGLPYSWLMVLEPIVGILVAGIGVALTSRRRMEAVRTNPSITTSAES